jgi:group I intron endonuclease
MVSIYKITSPSGSVYVGQSRETEVRMYRYGNLLCADQPRIYNSLKKYGSENHIFEICHELPDDVDQTTLDTYECLYMDLYRSCGIPLLNIKEGGSYGKHSPETISRMKGRACSEKLKEKNRLLKGKSYEDRFGIERAKKIKEKLRLSRLNKSWEEIWGNEKGNQERLNRSIRSKTNAVISILKNNSAKKRQKVAQYDLNWNFIKEWESMLAASKAFGLKDGHLTHYFNGVMKNCGGFHWKKV